MNTKNKEMIKTTRAFLRATGDPEAAIIAKYLPQGICAYLKFLAAMDAADKNVKLPAGMAIRHIEYELSDDADEATRGTMLAANWVGTAVRQAMMRDKLLNLIKKQSNVCCIDPDCPGDGSVCGTPVQKQVAYFGSDHEDEYNARVNG